MDMRYSDPRIQQKWSKLHKTASWSKIELAVIQARVNLGRVAPEESAVIRESLRGKPVDIKWWDAREAETGHDYDAYCDERKRHLPPELRHRWHEDLTTYDGVDPAFVLILHECVRIVKKDAKKLIDLLLEKANCYRYCLQLGKTHRQFAELQSYGKRNLTWRKQLIISYQQLCKVEKNLDFIKFAGPVGNYGLLDPELEKETCRILHRKVIYCVTQVIPRELFVPTANALSQMVQTLHKIADDICESTSGAYPICHVPFPKKGKGSSAMAWKRNPWRLEGIKGMADMALARQISIMRTIKTAFERDMGQSCVERVEWADIFHIVIYSIKTLSNVLEKLEVYPDNMMREIDDAHGTYAGLAARDFLIKIGFNDQEAYRIIQTAAWMTLRPTAVGEQMRKGVSSASEAVQFFSAVHKERRNIVVPSIQEIIGEHRLEFISSLEPTVEQINEWNRNLQLYFTRAQIAMSWDEIFDSAFVRTFKNEQILYKDALSID